MTDLIGEMVVSRQKNVESTVRKQWEELKPKIDEMSAKGLCSLHLKYGIGTSLADYLKKAGFNIETDRGDYLESGYTIITW